MIYLHWPQDISLDALKHVEIAVRERISYMQDDNAHSYKARQKCRFTVQEIGSLYNVANEARAMVEKASIGAIKVERRSPPIDEDALLG